MCKNHNKVNSTYWNCKKRWKEFCKKIFVKKYFLSLEISRNKTAEWCRFSDSESTCSVLTKGRKDFIVQRMLVQMFSHVWNVFTIILCNPQKIWPKNIKVLSVAKKEPTFFHLHSWRNVGHRVITKKVSFHNNSSILFGNCIWNFLFSISAFAVVCEYFFVQ